MLHSIFEVTALHLSLNYMILFCLLCMCTAVRYQLRFNCIRLLAVLVCGHVRVYICVHVRVCMYIRVYVCCHLILSCKSHSVYFLFPFTSIPFISFLSFCFIAYHLMLSYLTSLKYLK